MGKAIFWGFWEILGGFFAVFGPFSIDVRPSCFGAFFHFGLDIGALFELLSQNGGGGGLFGKFGLFLGLFGLLVFLVKLCKALATFLAFLPIWHFWPNWLTAIKFVFWPLVCILFFIFEKSRVGVWEKVDLIDRRPFWLFGAKSGGSLWGPFFPFFLFGFLVSSKKSRDGVFGSICLPGVILGNWGRCLRCTLFGQNGHFSEGDFCNYFGLAVRPFLGPFLASFFGSKNPDSPSFYFWSNLTPVSTPTFWPKRSFLGLFGPFWPLPLFFGVKFSAQSAFWLPFGLAFSKKSSP